jgi:2-hydroxy-3-keto-5-methylthiopentenyl-1-phosphate phosphatase
MKKIVFCDFDGTITAVETFAGMLKEFAPQLSAEIMPLLYDKKLTLREGVRQILESIPSTMYDGIIDYAASKPIREGLPELLDFLDIYQVPFVIISGGIYDMIETVLKRENLLPRIKKIIAVKVDTSKPFLQINSDYEGDTELVAKVKAMEQFLAEQTIAIGDSVTDINMALKADLIFARDRLIDYLKAENKPYIPWHNFHDIREYLSLIF